MVQSCSIFIFTIMHTVLNEEIFKKFLSCKRLYLIRKSSTKHYEIRKIHFNELILLIIKLNTSFRVIFILITRFQYMNFYNHYVSSENKILTWAVTYSISFKDYLIFFHNTRTYSLFWIEQVHRHCSFPIVTICKGLHQNTISNLKLSKRKYVHEIKEIFEDYIIIQHLLHFNRS